jgi:hypothetical protein
MKHLSFRPTELASRALLVVAASVVLAGCGANPTAATSGANPSPTPDVASARAAALTIFVKAPNLPPDVWSSCSESAANFAACPFSPAVVAGLNHLRAIGFGSDATGCGEDYLTGTQNGLNTEPQVLSTVAGEDGNVNVVIRRGPSIPDLTVTMTMTDGRWLASDLASGSGPSASLFSAKPNC